MLTPRARYLAIVEQVAREYLVTVEVIRGPWKNRRVVRARQEAMYRLRHETRLSTPQIGNLLNRDHSTVLYGIGRHGERVGA
jgi:chromosomal replication initiator protein